VVNLTKEHFMRERAFYITTTIPYVNADPHIGFALELVQADTMARYGRLVGKEVFFSTGTDEYGQKIWEASQKEGKSVQDYVDDYAERFLELKAVLNLSYDNFIRTTSPAHIKAAQEFWRLCEAKGDIYKTKYKGLYCVGCEKFVKDKDLVDGKCPEHPTKIPEEVEEENHFFKLTKYKKELLEYLKKPESITPEWRRDEALDFVENAMEDFSISRSKDRLSWGVAIPGDETQVMYVWFAAFVNYLSTLGWPACTEATAGKPDKFKKFWVDGYTVQGAGKDMVKFQSVMWQGMLMSAGLPNTDTIFYHGFITGEGGIKMSKSIGNVINPNQIVEEYGTDALRYFLLREISTFEDSPFTMERFKDSYNANLANGLGNLVSRIMKMAEDYLPEPVTIEFELSLAMKSNLASFDLKLVMDVLWGNLSELDEIIQRDEPFKLIKINPEKAKEKIINLVKILLHQAKELEPFLPETSQKIQELIKENKKPEKPLFPRKD
jgi:methionyl-tRNA synthetase